MKNEFAIPDSELATIAVAIKTQRLELDITQQDLADMAKVHRTYISKFERESANLSMRIFFELALALEITPSELLRQAALLEKQTGRKRKQKLPIKSAKPRAKAASSKK